MSTYYILEILRNGKIYLLAIFLKKFHEVFILRKLEACNLLFNEENEQIK